MDTVLPHIASLTSNNKILLYLYFSCPHRHCWRRRQLVRIGVVIAVCYVSRRKKPELMAQHANDNTTVSCS